MVAPLSRTACKCRSSPFVAKKRYPDQVRGCHTWIPRLYKVYLTNAPKYTCTIIFFLFLQLSSDQRRAVSELERGTSPVCGDVVAVDCEFMVGRSVRTS